MSVSRDQHTAQHHPDAAMTRSEERLAVSTRLEATERVVLSRYVVTEEVDVRVTLRREEIRIERHRLDGGDARYGPGSSGPDSSGDAASAGEVVEIVLHAEVPEIGTRVVPVERVRASVYTVTSDVVVSDDLAREQIVVEDATTSV